MRLFCLHTFTVVGKLEGGEMLARLGCHLPRNEAAQQLGDLQLASGRVGIGETKNQEQNSDDTIMLHGRNEDAEFRS